MNELEENNENFAVKFFKQNKCPHNGNAVIAYVLYINVPTLHTQPDKSGNRTNDFQKLVKPRQVKGANLIKRILCKTSFHYKNKNSQVVLFFIIEKGGLLNFWSVDVVSTSTINHYNCTPVFGLPGKFFWDQQITLVKVAL